MFTRIMSFINLFRKKRLYTVNLMVQFNEYNKPAIAGIRVRGIGNMSMYAYSRNEAEDLALKKANIIFPEYNGLIQIAM